MERLTAMRAAGAALLDDGFATLSGAELVEFLHAGEAHRRREAAVDQVLLARVEESRVAGDWAGPQFDGGSAGDRVAGLAG